jgi:site-specific recombinase XerD
MGKPKSAVAKVRVPGPLALFAVGFKVRLGDLGYTPLSRVTHLKLMAHLSRWLDANDLQVADLTDEYLVARRASGGQPLKTHRGLAPLLDFLATRTQLPPSVPPPAPSTPAEVLLASFRSYLVEERGVVEVTVAQYVSTAARFLAGCGPDADLSGVTAADVTGAVVRESEAAGSVASAKYSILGLRSFLRFCHLEALIGEDLTAAAMTVRGQNVSRLPQRISVADADTLLRSCDRRTAMGRRDYAVLLTLTRLGLRAGEVAAMRMEDVDWRAGELVVHGKARRGERLPLPHDVGAAISGYLLRGRPRSPRREMFLRVRVPHLPLTRSGISDIVVAACTRARIDPVRAHRLRHTLACAMVEVGVPLPQIGQVLRHRAAQTTTLYARVDVNRLRMLAQPWPEASVR